MLKQCVICGATIEVRNSCITCPGACRRRRYLDLGKRYTRSAKGRKKIRAWKKTPKGKAARKRWAISERGRAAARRGTRRRYATPVGKAAAITVVRNYRKTTKGRDNHRACNKRYRESAKGRAWLKAYRAKRKQQRGT